VSTSQVVLDAFGYEKGRPSREQPVVLSKITALLFIELESLVAELKQHEYSDEVINPITAPFDRLTTGLWVGAWTSYKGSFAASLPVLRSIGETPNLLTEDDAVVSQKDLVDLGADIEAERQKVQSSNLPQSVKKFIFHQLDIISAAIRAYPIAGVKAFKAAARDAILDESEHLEIIEQHGKSPEIVGLKPFRRRWSRC
jgi:hypothetical protein